MKNILLETGHDIEVIFRPVNNECLVERRDTINYYKLN